MTSTIGAETSAEWRQHWPVVLAGAAGYAASTITVYSSGLFIEPLQDEFGWTRAQIMSGHSIASIAAFVGAPLTGLAVDRFGPRRIGICAVILICLATAMFGLTGGNIWNWRALWLPMAFAIILIQPSVWTAAVTSLFTAGRGLALAVLLCGGSLSSIITPPLTFHLIENYGWRAAWAGLAVFWAFVSLPLILLFFTSAKDQERSGSTAVNRIAITPKESIWTSGVLSLRYLQILAGAVMIATVVVTLAVSVVPILSSSGIDRGEAAGIASLLGVSAIVGRLGIGALLDRMHGRFLAAACVTLPIVGIALIVALPGSIPAAAIAVMIFGLSLGAELDVIAYLTSRYFRTEHFGFLFGTIGGCLGLASANGPVILNDVFDRTGSYMPALQAAIPICIAAAVLFLMLGPYPVRAETTGKTR